MFDARRGDGEAHHEQGSSPRDVGFNEAVHTELSELHANFMSTIYNELTCLQERLVVAYQSRVVELLSIVQALDHENKQLKDRPPALGAWATAPGAGPGRPKPPVEQPGRLEGEALPPLPPLVQPPRVMLHQPQPPDDPPNDDNEALFAEIENVTLVEPLDQPKAPSALDAFEENASATLEEKAEAALCPRTSDELDMKIAKVLQAHRSLGAEAIVPITSLSAVKGGISPIAHIPGNDCSGCQALPPAGPLAYRACEHTNEKAGEEALRRGSLLIMQSMMSSMAPTTSEKPAGAAPLISDVLCQCGNTYTQDAMFCNQCGEKRPEAACCTTCGNIFMCEALFCRKCGTRRPGTRVAFAIEQSSTNSEKQDSATEIASRSASKMSFADHQAGLKSPDGGDDIGCTISLNGVGSPSGSLVNGSTNGHSGAPIKKSERSSDTSNNSLMPVPAIARSSSQNSMCSDNGKDGSKAPKGILVRTSSLNSEASKVSRRSDRSGAPPLSDNASPAEKLADQAASQLTGPPVRSALRTHSATSNQSSQLTRGDSYDPRAARKSRRSQTADAAELSQGDRSSSHGMDRGSIRRSVTAGGMSQAERMSRVSERESRLETGRFEVLLVWSADFTQGRKRVSSQHFGSGFFGGEEKLEDLQNELNVRWFMMHPSSPKRLIWDLLGLLLIGWDCVMVPLEAFQMQTTLFTHVMEWIVRVFWTLNMGMSFLVGYMRDDGMVEMRPRKVAKKYCRSWLILDIFVVGFDWSEFFNGLNGSNLNKVGTTLRGLRMIRTIRLFRMLKAPELTQKISEYIPMSEKLGLLGTIAKIMLSFLWTAHVCAALWWGIGNWIGDCDGTCVSWIEAENMLVKSTVDQYTMSFHWSLAAFSGDTSVVLPNNVYERTYVMCVLFLAFVVSASVVGGITTSMTRLQIILSEQTSKLAVLRRFLMDHHISRPLAVRVQRNAQFAMAEQKRKAPESSVELLSMISQPVLVEVHFEIHSKVVLNHPFMNSYNDVNPAGMRRVCHSAISMLSLHTKDMLFTDLEHPDHPKMFYVLSGRLMYTTSKGDPQLIEHGCWICEANMWTRWTHCGTLRAVCECRLLVVDSIKFQDIISSFPTDHAGLYAQEFVDWLNMVGVDNQCDAGPCRDETVDMVMRAFPLEDDLESEDEIGKRASETRTSGKGMFKRAASSVWGSQNKHHHHHHGGRRSSVDGLAARAAKACSQAGHGATSGLSNFSTSLADKWNCRNGAQPRLDPTSEDSGDIQTHQVMPFPQ